MTSDNIIILQALKKYLEYLTDLLLAGHEVLEYEDILDLKVKTLNLIDRYERKLSEYH